MTDGDPATDPAATDPADGRATPVDGRATATGDRPATGDPIADGGRTADDGTDPVPAPLRDRYDAVELRRQLHDVPPNEVYELSVDGRRAVLKRSTGARGDAGVEGRVQRRVGRATPPSVSVPEVLWVGADAFLAAHDPAVPGAGDDGGGDGADGNRNGDDGDGDGTGNGDPTATATEAWCRGAGRGLARIHDAVTFDRHGPLAVDGDPADPEAGLRVDAAPGATWADAIDGLLDTFRSSVAGTPYAAVVEDVREFLAAHPDRVAGADRRAGTDPVAGVDPVPVHGWFTPEHVAVGDGGGDDGRGDGHDGDGGVDDGDADGVDGSDGDLRAVVDFEHAMAGAAEYDLWRLAVPTFESPVAAPAPGTPWATFLDAYRSVRPLPDGFAARADAHRLLVATSYLDSLATQRGIEGNRDRADAAREAVEEGLAALRADWE